MTNPVSVPRELLPCPFCGGKAKKSSESLGEHYGYAKRVTCRCTGCGCERGAVGDTSKPGYADNSTVEQRALDAWNRRAAPVAAPSQDDVRDVEGLVGLLARLRGAINCNAENDVDQCGAWISTKHPMIERIDAALAAHRAGKERPEQPPANCRQRLVKEGKPYPRSSCQACGKFSPKWKECDAALSRQPNHDAPL